MSHARLVVCVLLPFAAGYYLSYLFRSMKKGRDYKRNGTTTLFAALNMLDGINALIAGDLRADPRPPPWRQSSCRARA